MTIQEARGLAAQIWCLPQFSSREMDPEFAEAIAHCILDAVRADRTKWPKWQDDIQEVSRET